MQPYRRTHILSPCAPPPPPPPPKPMRHAVRAAEPKRGHHSHAEAREELLCPLRYPQPPDGAYATKTQRTRTVPPKITKH